MNHDNKKEINALIRMMIYLKHELIRNDLDEESIYIEQAMKSIEDKLDLSNVESSAEKNL